jgi:hypothetical protein
MLAGVEAALAAELVCAVLLVAQVVAVAPGPVPVQSPVSDVIPLDPPPLICCAATGAQDRSTASASERRNLTG